jgi:hypothetical protein
MKRVMVALLMNVFVAGPVYAQTCATQAVSKEGKPLSGAAKTSYVSKCVKG